MEVWCGAAGGLPLRLAFAQTGVLMGDSLSDGSHLKEEVQIVWEIV